MSDMAQGWVDSDPEAIKGDVERLGMDAAVSYNLSLARDSADPKWRGIPRNHMYRAIRDCLKALED